MKRLVITISLLVFISTSAFAQINHDTHFDFRKAKWAMTKERVKHSEKGSRAIFLIESHEDLLYLDTIEHFQCLVTYYFIKGKLQRGVYAFIDHHSDFDFYVENYNKIKEALTEKYGSPTVEGPLSSSSSYTELGEDKTNDTSGSKGYVKLASRWHSQNTIIRLVLSDHNYKPRFVIEYQRKKFL